MALEKTILNPLKHFKWLASLLMVIVRSGMPHVDQVITVA
jgi:hypothetical protein